MARRRYVSTTISQDTRVNKLAIEYGDFAALLYTWMIPQAADDATLPGDPEELLYQVLPGRRDKTVDDVRGALGGMAALGLIEDAGGGRIGFPCRAFYKYQTYIKDRNREPDRAPEPPQDTAPQRNTKDNSAEQRRTAQNAVSFSPSSSFSPSPSPSVSPTTPPTPSAPSPVREVPPPLAADPPAPVPLLPRAVPKPTKVRPPNLVALFERQFWPPWPKKIAKDEALSAFVKANPTEEDVGRMVAAIPVQSEALDWPRENYRYCPNPATWLNQRRWEDEPPQESSNGAYRHNGQGRDYRTGYAAQRLAVGAPGSLGLVPGDSWADTGPPARPGR